MLARAPGTRQAFRHPRIGQRRRSDANQDRACLQVLLDILGPPNAAYADYRTPDPLNDPSHGQHSHRQQCGAAHPTLPVTQPSPPARSMAVPIEQGPRDGVHH
jgi:hypothetical protein